LTYKSIIRLAGIFGAIAVILGAFGAHSLADLINAKQLSSYRTGSMYHFYHSLLLLLIGIIYKLRPSKILRWSAWTCILGIICFSGSLYILACRDLIGLENTSIVGPITPIGGLFFLAAWILLILDRTKTENE